MAMPTNGEGKPSAFGLKLLRTLRFLVVSTVILYLSLAGLFVYIYMDALEKRQNIADVAVAVNDSLCALKNDLIQRNKDSEKFLREHPEGLPGSDIGPEQIQQSIDNTQRTIEALDTLSCPAPPLPQK